MANDLDHMLARLAQQTQSVSLDGFEDDVLAGLARRREEIRASRALTPIRAASVGLAMAVGVATAVGILQPDTGRTVSLWLVVAVSAVVAWRRASSARLSLLDRQHQYRLRHL